MSQGGSARLPLKGPTAGWMALAADNTGDVRVDGEIVGSIGNLVDDAEAALAHSRLTRFDLTPFLHEGAAS